MRVLGVAVKGEVKSLVVILPSFQVIHISCSFKFKSLTFRLIITKQARLYLVRIKMAITCSGAMV